MILVCGDYMQDEWWHGDVTRISPEAPVPVIAVKLVAILDGAAANVAANIRELGVECRTQFSERIETIRKIRLVANGRQEYRVDFDYPQEPVRTLEKPIPGIVIFVDYGKGTLQHVQRLIRDAKEAGAAVLVDPKGYDYEKYSGCDVLKPNLDEMRVMVRGWKDEEDLTKKAQELITKAEIGALLLTRASDGMSLYTKDGEWHWPSFASNVKDVTGAGEAAIAALGVGLHRGLSLEEASRYANKVAGLKVETGSCSRHF